MAEEVLFNLIGSFAGTALFEIGFHVAKSIYETTLAHYKYEEEILRQTIQNIDWHFIDGGYETYLFLNKSWTFYSPPTIPYIISPNVDIGQKIDTGFCKGEVTNFTKNNDTPTQYDVIEVNYPSIKIQNLGETHIFSSRTRYYERKTGLMVKEYFVNESTGESYLFKPEKIKIAEEIVEPEFNYHVPLIVLIIFLVAKKIRRRRNIHV